MTLLGKILACINVGFSLFLAVWFFGLYANRIDWTNAKAKDTQPAGELVARLARIDELKAALGPAEAAWRAPRATLLALEAQRPGDRQFYETELDLLRTKAKAGNPLAHVLVFENGDLALDPNDPYRPQLAAAKDPSGNPLLALTTYQAELAAAHAAVATAQQDLARVIKEDADLTDRMIGTKGEKGLQQRLQDERDKVAGVIEEQKLVRPLLINTYVESELILKRRQSLEARIKELGGTANVTRAMP